MHEHAWQAFEAQQIRAPIKDGDPVAHTTFMLLGCACGTWTAFPAGNFALTTPTFQRELKTALAARGFSFEDPAEVVIAAARAAYASGATHDCYEWIVPSRDGRRVPICAVCDRAIPECTCRTVGCGHPASSHLGGTCRECGKVGCWS